MKMIQMTAVAVLLATTQAFAATSSDTPEYDIMCRLKAKEIAAETYRGCVTEARTNQIDQIKNEYQDKLKAIKAEYEQELKKMGAGTYTKSTGRTSVGTGNSGGKKFPQKTAKNSRNSRTGNGRISAQVPSDVMNVELKKVPTTMSDDSVMEIPEPTPIENVPGVGSESNL